MFTQLLRIIFRLAEKIFGGDDLELWHYFLQQRVIADVVGHDKTFVQQRTAGNQRVVLQDGGREIFINQLEMAQTADSFGGHYPIVSSWRNQAVCFSESPFPSLVFLQS